MQIRRGLHHLFVKEASPGDHVLFHELPVGPTNESLIACFGISFLKSTSPSYSYRGLLSMFSQDVFNCFHLTAITSAPIFKCFPLVLYMVCSLKIEQRSKGSED